MSESKRNMVHQTIVLNDGTRKTIHHQKKWPVMSRKEGWDLDNKSPKPNSKRQKALRAKV